MVNIIELQYKIIPLPASFLAKLRHEGIDDLGQQVEMHIAQGGEPCRDVLRRAQPGERLLLASYCPFEMAGPYREYGPIFVLAESSTEACEDHSISCDADTSHGAYLQAQFVLRAYSAQERIVDACLSQPAQMQNDLERLFGRSEVAFVLVRFAAYGCYALRLERHQRRN